MGGAVDDKDRLTAFHTLVRDGRFHNADMNGNHVVDNLDITPFIGASYRNRRDTRTRTQLAHLHRAGHNDEL